MRKIAMAVLFILLVILSGCTTSSKVVTCYFCGNETKATHQLDYDGTVVYACDECYEQLSSFKSN